MQYLVMDLEWNNVFSRKTDGFVNEIIEFGAVLLDDTLKECGRFSTFIRPRIGKKLCARTRRLTHITNEDVAGGIPFPQALLELEAFIGSARTIVMTWGDTDLHVLLENMRLLLGKERIPFLREYLDLQRYCQQRMGLPLAQQVALCNAAAQLGISEDEYALHRALDDSLLSAECLRRTFAQQELLAGAQVCDDIFYARLNFRAHVIKDIESPAIDKKLLACACDQCGKPASRVSKWKFFNNAFHAYFYCGHCARKLDYSIRFKQYFDRLDIRTRIREAREKQEEASVVTEQAEEPQGRFVQP